jgi:hypothetical protein
MVDGLSALTEVKAQVGALARACAAHRGKFIPIETTRPLARAIATIYFEKVRPELDLVKERAGLVEEIDHCIHTILILAEAPREKAAFAGQCAELTPYLLESDISFMKARGNAHLLLSRTEKSIFETLARMLPGAAAAYEQALRDIASGKRSSWRGTATGSARGH